MPGQTESGSSARRRRRRRTSGSPGLAKALERLERLLQSENQQVAFRAVREYLDRSLGKAGQPTPGEAGDELSRAQAIAAAKEEFTIEMDKRAAGSRAKLIQLLDRRAHEIAAGNGTSDRLLPHDLS